MEKSRLDRTLSLFTEVRAGEGAKALLMLVNIFLLLICYSVIKTVREPLILLGGGAEVRSYAAAGQALLLMGFVPLYSWFASRVDRVKLLAGATMFFIVCIELFALAVTARVPYVGVAFFIWVGIFNMSLVAQFWSFANDIYTKEDGDRLFPMIAIGMTAGAPIGSFVSARLFRLGFAPQVILQVSAVLLTASLLLYLWINARETARTAATPEPLGVGGGFRLVLSNGYLRLIALLVVLLNIVNTTGEYVVARLLTAHVNELALADAAFDKRAYIGAFSGDYQFWVNVTAFLLQAFVTSRLIKHRGLRGALLALPLIALGGYSIIAAGVGFSVVRWIKTAENAADYSIMNTARQLLWLKTTREEKYKAKQAIDTFFVRGGDLLSAGVVFLGTSVLHLGVADFAKGNVVLTIVWIGVALLIARPAPAAARLPRRGLVTAAAVALVLAVIAAPASAQEKGGREAELAAEREAKAANLHPYVPTRLERRILAVENALLNPPPVYAFIGSAYPGGALAIGPGWRGRFGDSGSFDAHAAWSIKNYKAIDASVNLPAMMRGRLRLETHANWIDAPALAFYGIGNAADAERSDRPYRATTAGASARVQPSRIFAVGGGLDSLATDGGPELNPTYVRSRAFAEVDTRTSPGYTRRGGLYRVEAADYRQSGGGPYGFRRVDAEVNQFVPLGRENWVIALRALASTTSTEDGSSVPFFLMPDLGGSRSLRGYPTWRFRDRNRLLLTGEYRWTTGPFLDMALFADAGKVAGRARDLTLRDLKKSYGVGLSFHAPKATLLRVELARGSEGTSLSLAFRPSF